MTGDRDRDPAGRPRQARPRDALGRPLPYGAVGVEPVSEEPLHPSETLEVAREVTEMGNVNAVSDGAAAAQLLAASTWAALANVEINLASIKDEEYVETTRFEVDRLRALAEEARARAEAAFSARLAD